MTAATVLGNLTLGYRLLWNRARQPAAVELFVDTDPVAHGVDARHLQQALAELWPAQAPPLILAIRHPALLQDMLLHGTAEGPWVRLPHSWLASLQQLRLAQRAHTRGLRLVWHGAPGQHPDAMEAALAQQSMLQLDEAQTLQALRAARGLGTEPSPVQAGVIYEGLASRALVRHALDQQQAWAVTGWPAEEVLSVYSDIPLPPGREAITQLLQAIDHDASLEAIEHRIGDEPVLAYRFLCHVNTPPPGRHGAIESVYRGLMVLGLGPLQAWLRTQLATAGTEADHLPVRRQLVTRARLLEHLLDAGESEELRREVHLCGLLAHIDQQLGEPLQTALARLPLSERVLEALLQHTGPYADALQLAQRLEGHDTAATRQSIETLEWHAEDVNRALLRTLGGLLTPLPRR